MKIILTEEQFERYKCFLKENLENEGRNITNQKAYKTKVQPLIDKLNQELYGDELNTVNAKQSERFGLNNDNQIVNTMQLASGLFSIGNAKLSDDTLIINFTSALQCPSVSVCPVTQQACYAVAGEIRLPVVRRKNLMVQNMWKRAIKNDKIGEVFGIAQMYIEILKNTKKPIKYVRFNEAGDFLNQKVLNAAALFASTIRKRYGVMSMAYTANKFLDFTVEIDGQPIDKIIKINASRLDIKLSDDSVNNSFLATNMDFSSVLEQNDKVVSISENELEKNHFECLGVVKDPETGAPSVPILAEGKWTGGNGWYYVCPCSFWRFNKDKATLGILKMKGVVDKNIDYIPSKELANIVKEQPEELKSFIRTKTNGIKSPCGTLCSVCHNISGGISFKDSKKSPDKWKMIKNYTVLEATHGATSSKYKTDYANAKRRGDDSVIYSPENPHGRITKFDIENNEY